MVVVGGYCIWTYAGNPTVERILRRVDAPEGLPADMCAGTYVLGQAGLLKGTTASGQKLSARRKKYGAVYTGRSVEVDGRVVTGKGPPAADDTLVATLSQYRRPGNVRELRNVLERALMIRPHGPLIVDMPERAAMRDGEWSCSVRYPKNSSLDDVTRAVIGSLCREALRRFGGARPRLQKHWGFPAASCTDF